MRWGFLDSNQIGRPRPVPEPRVAGKFRVGDDQPEAASSAGSREGSRDGINGRLQSATMNTLDSSHGDTTLSMITIASHDTQRNS